MSEPQYKICNRCHNRKNTNEFFKTDRGIMGVRGRCKECEREISRAKYKKDKENGTLKKKPEYTKGGVSTKLLMKKAYDKYRYKNKDIINERNRDRDRERYHNTRKFDKNYKAKQKIISRNHKENNRAKVNANARKWGKIQRENNTDYYISTKIRASVLLALKRKNALKTHKTNYYLGCSVSFALAYLNSLGYISNEHDIDHIVPISVFNMAIDNHIKVACHYLNLQPLNPSVNRSKGAKLLEGWQDKIQEICISLNIESKEIIEYIQDKKGVA